MARVIAMCPECKNAVWCGNSFSMMPQAFQGLKNYTQHWDDSYDDCKCEAGKKLKQKAESMSLTLDKELDFGKYRGKTVKWILENDLTYVTVFLIEKSGFTTCYEVDEYIEIVKISQ